MDGSERVPGWCPAIPARDAPAASCAHVARRSRDGFSLIELLVVIGLIAVLLAFLLPVLSMARSSAMKVVCVGRLRELTLASRMYCDENDMYPQPLEQGEVD